MTIEFTIGCDPEFFVKKDGKLISAHGLVPGTKHSPFKLPSGAVQVDGMALEFNTDPTDRFDVFDRNIEQTLENIQVLIGKEYEFDFSSVAHFGKEYIDSQPPVAKELGCDPDYNAYTGEANPRPDGNTDFRTASGHIHIGWTKDMDPFDPEHFEACRMLTKQLDMALGVVSPFWDSDTTRASMYGKLGTFRPKSYGVEYRVLSNKWVNHKALREIVFKLTRSAAVELLNGNRYYTDAPQNLNTHTFFSLCDRHSYNFSRPALNLIELFVGLSLGSKADHLIPVGSPFLPKKRMKIKGWEAEMQILEVDF